MDIKINPRFKALIPDLEPDEKEQLENDIKARGCRDRLVTWRGELLDGHNRLEICRRNGIEFETFGLEFDDEDSACIWIIRNQFGRRNLSIGQRAALAVELMPLLEKEARKKQAEVVTRRHVDDKKRKEIEKSNPYWKPLPLAAQMEIDRMSSDLKRKGKTDCQRVYFIATGTKQIKIGISAFPLERLKTFQTNDPSASFIADIPGGAKVEKWLHEILASERIGKSEVFNDTPKVRSEIAAICSLGNFTQTTEFHSAAIAGKTAGVSPSYIKQAKKLKEESPEIFQSVKRGEIKLREVTAHVSNNSGKIEWYTPVEYIEAARAAMGGIDCDPASSKIANKAVKAEAFFTKEDDGLVQKWSGRVWMNPPYAQPLMGNFAEAVASKFESGEIKQACVLVNNATETAWFQRMLGVCSAVCFPKRRIKFVDVDGNSGAPLQGQAVLYFGNQVSTFRSCFKIFGGIVLRE